MDYLCPQCKRRVDELFQQVFFPGKVCLRCFELEAKEGILEELEWTKFQLYSRLRELMEESFWEADFAEEKAYLRDEIKDCDEKINRLNREIDELT